MANNPNAADNLTHFKKGDPKINRKGRPKTFDKMRALMQSIAHETATDKDGKPLVIDGHKVTNIEAFVRQMLLDPKDRRLFLEYAFGKPKEEVELSGQVANLTLAEWKAQQKEREAAAAATLAEFEDDEGADDE